MRAAMLVVIAFEALEEIVYVWRRLTRSAASWWDGVEHRERVQLRRAELGYLARRFPSR